MNAVTRRIALYLTAATALLAVGPSLAQDNSGFPFTYSHAYGETTIPAKPERVVSISTGGNGLAQAVDATLVGAWRNRYAENGQDPWLQPYGEETHILSAESGGVLNFEEIAALEPDVIIAVDGAMPFNLAEAFPRLNDIAPTIVPVQGGNRLETYDVIGAALGEPEKLKALINRIDARIASLRETFAPLSDKSVAYGQVTRDEVGIQVDPTIAASVQLLAALGFEPPASIVTDYDAAAARTPGTVHYSWENAGALNAADIVLLGPNGVTEGELATNPLFERLDVRQDGRLHIIPTELLLAVMLYGPYNADWVLDQLEPLLATLGE